MHSVISVSASTECCISLATVPCRPRKSEGTAKFRIWRRPSGKRLVAERPADQYGVEIGAVRTLQQDAGAGFDIEFAGFESADEGKLVRREKSRRTSMPRNGTTLARHLPPGIATMPGARLVVRGRPPLGNWHAGNAPALMPALPNAQVAIPVSEPRSNSTRRAGNGRCRKSHGRPRRHRHIADRSRPRRPRAESRHARHAPLPARASDPSASCWP